MKRASIGSAEATPAGNEHFSGSVSMKMLAEVDAPRNPGIDHPLQRAVNRRAADARVLPAD